MPANSLTYQQLPNELLEPLMCSCLTVAEASMLWDQALLSEEGRVEVTSENLAAICRLESWRRLNEWSDSGATRH